MGGLLIIYLRTPDVNEMSHKSSKTVMDVYRYMPKFATFAWPWLKKRVIFTVVEHLWPYDKHLLEKYFMDILPAILTMFLKKYHAIWNFGKYRFLASLAKSMHFDASSHRHLYSLPLHPQREPSRSGHPRTNQHRGTSFRSGAKVTSSEGSG